ncbi:arylsulfatase [Verrucomicrobiaceae bacterium N1E253]|uniref:Arylsulfatase n=1 Tax=Oceaniferula marina TaxID=2748318 RepID=A0A851GCK0_9BACT|nr:arylsulfatase [Oceaniferula marina]NWK54662.1 arylsulfatase [Oceaniferula marina]
MNKTIKYIISGATTMGLGLASVSAEAVAPPGSPSSTTTIDGKQLPPPPDKKFDGEIERNVLDSTPYWPPRMVAPEGAPNILLIITDDAGYGVSSTFGGVIPTPAMDRIAKQGLRYTHFHSTAVCSPTRASLISGRNHHRMGMGTIPELSTGYPGYNGMMTKDKATVARILKGHGYVTSWFGKNHNTPDLPTSKIGPFDQWPLGMGFDYFYGFMGGDTSQWQPGNLVRNTTYIYPYENKPGWNLVTAMADDAIGYMKTVDALNPDQPFFVYYAPGATHAPHHPTPEWIDKISKMHLFDEGWHQLRETIFANQKKLGVIPADAKLTPWPNDLIKRWDQLSDLEKKLFIKQADVFAAYVAYTDHEIGRVIQAVEDLGKLDNTLIIYITGDNGTSSEGGPTGTPNEVASVQGLHLPVEAQMKYYDVWGSEQTYPHMSVGWTWAFGTPFSWTKMVCSHFGGTKQGTVISWPKVIKEKGGVRHQFHHVVDIAPTILEAVGVPLPDEIDGIKQEPMDGVSMLYTFDTKNAEAPSKHKTQYFEMIGDRAIYHDGWILSTKVMRTPWDNSGKGNHDPASWPWELYDLSKDWTQSNDVAAQYPDKVKALEKLFWEEADKNQVLPMDTTTFTRSLLPRPNLTAGRSSFTYAGEVTGTPNGNAPNVLASSYNIKAEVVIPDGGAEGMMVTHGGRFAGYGFYLLKGKPVYVYNLFGMQRVRWEGKEALSAGKHTLEFDFQYDGLGADTLKYGSPSGLGRGGTGTLKVDGKVVATKKMEKTIPMLMQWCESFDVGADTGSPVSDQDYQTPFRFTGTLEKLTLSIDRPKLTEEDIQKLKSMQHSNPASE